MITTQFPSKIKRLRTNNGMEDKESSLIYFFYLKMEQLLKDFSLELHLKMGMQKEKIDIFGYS